MFKDPLELINQFSFSLANWQPEPKLPGNEEAIQSGAFWFYRKRGFCHALGGVEDLKTHDVAIAVVVTRGAALGNPA